MKFYRRYQNEIKCGEITRKEAIKEYTAITLLPAPLVTLASYIGLGFMTDIITRMLDINIMGRGEGCAWFYCMFVAFVFASLFALSLSSE